MLGSTAGLSPVGPRVRRMRATRWESLSPPNDVSLAFRDPKTGYSKASYLWSGANTHQLRLNVRANRCIVRCLNGTASRELSTLLAIPGGRDALQGGMGEVGELIAELFRLTDELLSESSSFDVGAARQRMENIRAQWHSWALHGDHVDPAAVSERRSPSERPSTAPLRPSVAGHEQEHRPMTSSAGEHVRYARASALASGPSNSQLGQDRTIQPIDRGMPVGITLGGGGLQPVHHHHAIDDERTGWSSEADMISPLPLELAIGPLTAPPVAPPALPPAALHRVPPLPSADTHQVTLPSAAPVALPAPTPVAAPPGAQPSAAAQPESARQHRATTVPPSEPSRKARSDDSPPAEPTSSVEPSFATEDGTHSGDDGILDKHDAGERSDASATGDAGAGLAARGQVDFELGESSAEHATEAQPESPNDRAATPPTRSGSNKPRRVNSEQAPPKRDAVPRPPSKLKRGNSRGEELAQAGARKTSTPDAQVTSGVGTGGPSSPSKSKLGRAQSSRSAVAIPSTVGGNTNVAAMLAVALAADEHFLLPSVAEQTVASWTLPQQATARKLQALVWLLSSSSAGDTEAVIHARLVTACEQMQRAGQTFIRLYHLSPRGALTCYATQGDETVPLSLPWATDATGIVAEMLRSDAPVTRLIFRPMGNKQYTPAIDGTLVKGQPLILVPFEVETSRYVMSVIVAPVPELYVDASSPALVELRVFVEAAARHACASIERLEHVRKQRGGGFSGGSPHMRKLAFKLALKGVAVEQLRARDRRLLTWYRTIANVACTRLPKAREAEIVNEVQLTLMNASDVNELTENVMTTFQRLIHAERSTLYLYDWKRNTLTSCFAAGAKNFELKCAPAARRARPRLRPHGELTMRPRARTRAVAPCRRRLSGVRLGVIGLAVVNNENILVEVRAPAPITADTCVQPCAG